MGNLYKNDMFVADAKKGNIYHFKLDVQRDRNHAPSIGPLADGVANSSDSLDQIIFGKGFGAITNLKTNPFDGNLYVLTFDETQGTIFRIIPINKYEILDVNKLDLNLSILSFQKVILRFDTI